MEMGWANSEDEGQQMDQALRREAAKEREEVQKTT